MKLEKLYRMLKEAEGEQPIDTTQQTAPQDQTSSDTPIEQIWETGADKVQTYISNAEYSVRQNGSNFEVYSVEGATRKLLQNMDVNTLNATYKKAREDDVPGADGFVTYLNPNKVEAFKYDGDSTMVLIDRVRIPLIGNDYVVKSVVNNNFVYSIQKQFDFENTMEPTQ